MSLLLPRIRRLTILDNRGELTRFAPNPGQLKLLQSVEDQFASRQRVRNIVLKARQIGFSTVIEAIAYELCWLWDDYAGLVMAHHRETAQSILTMTKRFQTHDPFKRAYTLATDSKADLEWLETRSSLKVATAGNRESARGMTFRFVHQSEAAFYPDPTRTMNALRNAIHPVPTTAMFIESTANGVGNQFHTEWELATSGESDFVPLFFPWHEHPEYRATAIGVSPVVATKDEDERVLCRAFNLDDDQLAWRRWKLRDLGGDLLKFHQEYPSDPEEAFLSTGANVFPSDHLRDHYEQTPGYRGLLLSDSATGVDNVKFVPSRDGHLTIYKAPAVDQDYGQYVIGADPTHTTFGDFAVAQVLNRRTLEQVAVLRLRCDPVAFAKELFKLGAYYNFALVAPEVEGPGGTTIGVLNGLNYPNIYLRADKLDRTPGKLTGSQWGWSTSMQTKHMAVSWGINALTTPLDSGGLLLHDPTTYREMKSYQTLPNGGYGNGSDNPHDDTVMALLIAVAAHFTGTPPQSYGVARYGQATNMQLGSPVQAGALADRLGVDLDDVAGMPGVVGGVVDVDDMYGGEIEQPDYMDD